MFQIRLKILYIHLDRENEVIKKMATKTIYNILEKMVVRQLRIIMQYDAVMMENDSVYLFPTVYIE